MSEFNKQVSITLNQTAKVVSALFPAQLFNVCDGDKFEYTFQHNLLPPNSGIFSVCICTLKLYNILIISHNDVDPQ